jgi:hypothetical protein
VAYKHLPNGDVQHSDYGTTDDKRQGNVAPGIDDLLAHLRHHLKAQAEHVAEQNGFKESARARGRRHAEHQRYLGRACNRVDQQRRDELNRHDDL